MKRADSRPTECRPPPGWDGATDVTAFFIAHPLDGTGYAELVMRTLVEKGFDPLLTIELDASRRQIAQRYLDETAPRTAPVAGAEFTSLIIAHDLMPITPSAIQRADSPQCDNARILSFRAAVQTEVEGRGRGGSQHSPVHATDNSRQAWEVVDLFAPGEVSNLHLEIARRGEAFAREPALTDLTRFGCRAKVELIEYDGAKAIRKTFRPGAERLMQRELEVMKALGPVCREIPRLIAEGPDYFLTEFVEDSERWYPRPWPFPLPLARVRQLAQFIRTCLAHGFDPIDVKPQNNVLFTRTGMKVIDYEFWRRCDPTILPEQSFCLAGLPEDYSGDRPLGIVFTYSPYPSKWFHYTALSLRSFLYDPAWLQRFKRFARLSYRIPGLLIRQAIRGAWRASKLSGSSPDRVQ